MINSKQTVLKVTHEPDKEPTLEILPDGLNWLWQNGQIGARIMIVEKQNLLWFKFIYDVDPEIGHSVTVKTVFDDLDQVWEFLTHANAHFYGIPIWWLDRELWFTQESEKPK